MGRQSIEERRGEFLVARKHGDPLGKGEVGRDDRGPALVAIRNQIEEQLAADAVEGHEAELIDDQHVHSEQALLEPGELAAVAGLEQLAHEVGRARKKHAPLPLRRLHAQRDDQVRLAGDKIYASTVGWPGAWTLTHPATEPADQSQTRILASQLTANHANGYLFFMRAMTMMAQPFDRRRLQLSVTLVAIADAIRTTWFVTEVFSVSPGGALA
jgi:hypothetical protein